MSNWTDWRDDFTAWAQADPWKALTLFALGFGLASLVSWVL